MDSPAVTEFKALVSQILAAVPAAARPAALRGISRLVKQEADCAALEKMWALPASPRRRGRR